jgi:flagellar hook-associated protein 2
MTDIMLEPVEIDGENVYLSDFGINTLSYFESEDNEKNALHIDGDEDDGTTSGKTNVLSSLISTDPEKLTAFFTGLTRSLYTSMNNAMSRTSLSSMFTVYNDKKMAEDYADYTSEIADYEEELADYEERYYAKFSAMEVALAKMESNSSAITSLLGE